MPEPRILMVDDNPEIREVVSVLLEGEGFVIDEAQSGRDALAHIKNYTYDLILLDVMMPGLNGYQTCVEIRRSSNVPILFLSARSQVEDKTLGFSSWGRRLSPKTFFLSGTDQQGKSPGKTLSCIPGKRPEKRRKGIMQRQFENLPGSRDCMEK